MVDPRSAGLCFLLLAAGCGGMRGQPPDEASPPAAVSDVPAAVQPLEIGASPAEKPAAPPATERDPGRAVAVPSPAPAEGEKAKGADRGVAAPTAAAQEASPAAVTAPPAPEKAPPAPVAPKVATAPAAIKPPARTEPLPAPQSASRKPEVARAAETPRPPALDLKALERRLRETNAIGLMTKLTLKGQVEDLLDRFRAYHEGRARVQLAELRQPYDSLILKVLALLQERDPSLASEIASSREAIWSILTDRTKFSQL